MTRANAPAAGQKSGLRRSRLCPAVFTPAAAPSAFFGMKRGAGILVPVAGRQPCGLIRLTFSSFSLPQTVWFLVNGGYGFRSAPEPKGVSAGRRLPRRERRIGCLYRRFCLLGPRGVAHEVKTTTDEVARVGPGRAWCRWTSQDAYNGIFLAPLASPPVIGPPLLGLVFLIFSFLSTACFLRG